MHHETLLVVQIAIAVVFSTSSVMKLWSINNFAQNISEYNILPKSLTVYFAVVVAVSELFVGIAHATGWRLNLARPLAVVLLLTFAIAVIVALSRGAAIPCYCFGQGVGQDAISWRTLARLGFLLV
jgi:uncharacterized membrane protein YphA (DoxX/SURF4 family)